MDRDATESEACDDFEALFPGTGIDCRLASANLEGMGFALWTKDDLAWAQGTSEYRALGVAVISITDLFQQRDFKARRPLPSRDPLAFRGMFASIGALNGQLRRWRRRPRARR